MIDIDYSTVERHDLLEAKNFLKTWLEKHPENTSFSFMELCQDATSYDIMFSINIVLLRLVAAEELTYELYEDTVLYKPRNKK